MSNAKRILATAALTYLSGQQKLLANYLRGLGHARLSGLLEGRSGGAAVALAHATEAEVTGPQSHRIAVVLGSGWGGAAELIGETTHTVPTADLPGFAAPSVPGHNPTVRSVRLKDGVSLVSPTPRAAVLRPPAGSGPALAAEGIAVTVPAGIIGGSNMRVKIVYDGPVKAPIKQGQHIANLVVTTGDTPPQTMPLIAAEAVDEAGFFGRIMAGFASLFA